MLKQLSSLLLSSLLGLTVILTSGCGGDSGSGASTGPGGASSFAGSSMSFNPTVNFLTGTTLTYLNTTVGSPFPAAAVATNGTFTYTPNASFTAGTLTLTVDGIPDPIVLEIADFVRSGANVTGFTAKSGGTSYPVTVTGTLAAYVAPSGGGGGGLGAGETTADDLPSSVLGSYTLTFFASDVPLAGLPASGGTKNFVIAARTLTVGSKTLTNPVYYNDNKLEWLFKDGSVTYALNLDGAGGLNEINVYGPVGGSNYYGQYRDSIPVTLSGGKPSSGTIYGIIGYVFVPTGFPAADALSANTAVTFTLGSDTVTYAGNTYTYTRTEPPAVGFEGAPTYFFYTFVADEISIGVTTFGGSSYISNASLSRTRTAEAPASGSVTANFYLSVHNAP